MIRPGGWLFALLLVVALGSSSASAAVVLDRILVVVNGQPITKSRVDFYRAYLTAMSGGGLGWPRPVQDVARLTPEALLEIVVVDEVLFEGGSRVEALQVREKALTARIERFRQSFSSSEAYDVFVTAHELTPDVLREFFSRRLRVEGYIGLKVGAGRPSEAEMREYYQSHPGSMRGRSFEDAREEIERALYLEQAAERFEQWVSELQQRAIIQVPSREAESPR